MIGRQIFKRNDLFLARKRKPELNKYLEELLKLTEKVSQSKLVLDFFARESGEEIDENIAVTDVTAGRVDKGNQSNPC